MKRFIVPSLAFALVGCGGGGGGDRGNALDPVNQAPVVQAESDAIRIDANTNSVTSVTLSDDRTSPTELSIALSSDNETLFPGGTLALDGNGAMRTIELMPTLDEVGIGNISINVTDAGGLTGTTVIRVDVDPLSQNASTFSRELASGDELDDPKLINAIEFIDDAEDDDFTDLLDL